VFIRKSKLALAVASVACLALPASAYATNGYFAHGYGTASKAMGGAGIALAEVSGSMAAATNPAGMAFAGDRIDMGWELFMPERGYDCPEGCSGIGADQQRSDNSFFAVPFMGMNFKLTPDDTFGVTLFGNGGMNTEYAKALFGSNLNKPAGVDLIQMFVSMTYAHKFNDNTAVGISVIPIYQKFKAYGIGSFSLLSSDPANFSNTGDSGSFGVGTRLGGQIGVGGGVTLGGFYQPRVNMSEFERYAGLFAEQGDFDIPTNYGLGVAWKALPNLKVLFDYQFIDYSDVASVGNAANFSGGLLGTDNGPGFGWDSINIFKLGVEYTTGSWTWRAGWNHGDNPVDNGGPGDFELTFNILAPGVVTDHLTFGFTKQLSNTMVFNVAAMYAFNEKVEGYDNSPVAAGEPLSIDMTQYAFEMSLGVKF
jgi:long-chain fatty acid transport protein